MILDLHIHSKYSFDSILEPATIIKVAKERGLNGVAITDHDTIQGGVEAKRINKDPNFIVIVGCEINTEVGDIIGLFLNKELLSRNSMEVIEEIKAQGGIVVLPHPYKGHTLTDDLLEHVDIIECFNSRTGKYENFCAEELARKHNKPQIAGSDAHFASEIGRSRTIFGTKGGIKANLVNGTTNLDVSRSPAYLISISQIIKSIKMKKYKQIPVQLAALIIKEIRRK